MGAPEESSWALMLGSDPKMGLTPPAKSVPGMINISGLEEVELPRPFAGCHTVDIVPWTCADVLGGCRGFQPDRGSHVADVDVFSLKP